MFLPGGKTKDGASLVGRSVFYDQGPSDPASQTPTGDIEKLDREIEVPIFFLKFVLWELNFISYVLCRVDLLYLVMQWTEWYDLLFKPFPSFLAAVDE